MMNQRWAFKDYFSWHSDLRQYENQFLGRYVTTQIVVRHLR